MSDLEENEAKLEESEVKPDDEASGEDKVEEDEAQDNGEDLEAKAEKYKQDIALERQQKSGSTKIKGLYEEAVAACPLDSSLWLDYIHYGNSLSDPELALSVTDRATTNCPWILETWMEYFIVAERHDEDRLLGIFEKALANCATNDQIGLLWIKYLESLRRMLKKKDFPEKSIQIFSSSCEAAEKHILSAVDRPVEPNEYVFAVAMMNVRLLASLPERIKQAREAWEDLLIRGYGTSFRNWLPYLILEHRHGDESSYRQQLSKATAYIKDDLRSIADLWLSFERDNGKVNQLRACEKKITKYMQELEAARFARPFSSRKRPRKPTNRGPHQEKRPRGPEDQTDSNTTANTTVNTTRHWNRPPKMPTRMIQRRAPTAFVPRSLQIQGHNPTNPSDPPPPPPPAAEPTIKMTNKDFRAKFLGCTHTSSS